MKENGGAAGSTAWIREREFLEEQQM